ncbi:MAG: hypothetical protein AAF590_02945 [Pseudomonadota bacterium]
MDVLSNFKDALLDKTAIFIKAVLLLLLLFPVQGSAGPLQNKIMSLTYQQKFSQFLDDTTWIYHDGSVGTLVIHLNSRRSAAAIWHSDSERLVTGRWGGAAPSASSILCLYLGHGVSVLPPAHDVGIIPDNRSRCYNLLNFSHGVSNVLAGDPFGLFRTEQAPAVMSGTGRYSAQALMQLSGGDPSVLRRAAY